MLTNSLLAELFSIVESPDPFGAGANNFQSISAMQRNRVWLHETSTQAYLINAIVYCAVEYEHLLTNLYIIQVAEFVCWLIDKFIMVLLTCVRGKKFNTAAFALCYCNNSLYWWYF